ncbi:hypothetical protein [Aquimarina sp. I32.4]|uniref:hypothetical protein n=1 Tax=Aquimarina sp. I32.4 TaxID=2053903 RepID=UPI000CDE9261|nr:hypothetical protein [Aquimarina sp. I32.4]
MSKKTRKEQQFISQNMYHGKSSKSIYSPLIGGVITSISLLACAYFLHLDIIKMENGEQVMMNNYLYLLYEALGGQGAMYFLYGAALFSLILSIYVIFKRKKMKDQ